MGRTIALLFVLVIIIIVGVNMIIKYLKGKKLDKIIEENEASYEYIYQMNDKIKEELKRCEKISKNEKTLELLGNWKKEYKLLNDSIQEIRDQEKEIKELSLEKDVKNFFRETENSLEYLEQMRPYIDSFYEKLKNYTNYEIDNTQMALNLKERLKELTNVYDQKIKMMETYNNAFLEETTQIKILINKFEVEQKKGNYPRARVVLKDCNDLLVKLERNIEILVEYYEIMYSAEEKMNILKNMKNSLEEIGLKEFEKTIEDKYQERQQKRDELLMEIKKVDFTDTDSLEISLNEVKYFEEQIDGNIKTVEGSYLVIENIMKIQEVNEQQIQFIDDLIKGAIEEKTIIEKLYSIEDISHFEKINEEKEKFSKFKEDYTELNSLFRDETSNFKLHEEKFTQSSRYLNRVLSNVKLVIEGLQAIRSDEIEIIDKVDIYKKELIKINLYLREHKHLEKLNSGLESMYFEIGQKIKILEEELLQEPLDIGNVRINNDVIEKLIRKLIFDMETDIKQRKGVEKLILYYNRFITTHEYAEYYKHFLSLYNTKEYRQILKEIHNLFVQINPKGDDLYKNIVSTIKIEDYKSEI